MNSDYDPMLESDQLEELLETPAPSPPVVVVQYRNRGVPPWMIITIIIVTLAGFGLYHKLVVERYRVQAAQDRSLILRKLEADRAAQPLLVRETGASTTVLPIPIPGAGEASGSSVSIPAGAIVPGVEETKAASASNPPNWGSEGASLTAPSQLRGLGSAAPNPLAVLGQSGPMPNLRPFSDNAGPAKPLAPTNGIASTADIGTAKQTLPAPTGGPEDKSVEGAIRGQPPAGTPDNGGGDPAAPSNGALAGTIRPPGAELPAGAPDPGAQGPDRDGSIGPKPLPPLPTVEESKRQIEEEAARREAEIIAQVENRNADLKSKWLEEQTKFREELAEVVRSKGMRAGPDIANLDKRYAYQGDPIKAETAYQMWRLMRTSEKAKVNKLRSLELPETKILEFMCSSLHGTIGTRRGPRDENEVRVRAAMQLLKYPLGTANPGPSPENGDGVGPPAARKTIISTPR
jgi:hypothetical protein